MTSPRNGKLIFFSLHQEFVAAAREHNFKDTELKKIFSFLQTHHLTAKPSVAIVEDLTDKYADEFYIRQVSEELCQTIAVGLKDCAAIRHVELT